MAATTRPRKPARIKGSIAGLDPRATRSATPLIDRERVILAAIEIMDRDGPTALTIAGVAGEVGINVDALRRAYADAAALRSAVRQVLALEAWVAPRHLASMTWQDFAMQSAIRYRQALIRYPGASQAMVSPAGGADVWASDQALGQMIFCGAPAELCFPILESVHALAHASVVDNPRQEPPRTRDTCGAPDSPYRQALRAAPPTAVAMFREQLIALVTGWELQVPRR